MGAPYMQGKVRKFQLQPKDCHVAAVRRSLTDTALKAVATGLTRTSLSISKYSAAEYLEWMDGRG